MTQGLWSAQPYAGHLYHSPHSYGSRHITKKEGGKILREFRRDYYGTASSGHNRAVVLATSQPLWLPAQGLQKTKPINIPAWVGEGTTRTYSWLLEEGEPFFKGVAPGP